MSTTTPAAAGGSPATTTVTPATIRAERPEDADWIEPLHDVCFGPGRYARTAFRVRERIEPDPSLAYCAEMDGVPIASVKMTPIALNGIKGHLLGPLATDPVYRNKGAGKALVKHVTAEAMARGSAFVMLIGDPPYYSPLGYVPTVRGSVCFPGPVDPDRILVHCPAELIESLSGDVGPWRD